MTGTRSTAVVDDTEELLNVVDLDVIGDVETLLMFIPARPVGLEDVCNLDRDLTRSSHPGDKRGRRLRLRLPTERDRTGALSAHTADDLGPYELAASLDDAPRWWRSVTTCS